MRTLILIFLVGLTGITTAHGKSPEQQMLEILRALPEAMRIDATVIGYQDGNRTVLKAGSGSMICWADDPGTRDPRGAYFVNCFPKSLKAFENRRAELASGRGHVITRFSASSI